MKYVILSLLMACTGPAGISYMSLINTVPASPNACPNGGIVVISAVDINHNFQIDCGDANIQSSTVCNGANGSAGATGAQGSVGAQGNTGPQGASIVQSPYTPVQAIEPCGPTSSSYKEVLLVLSNGDILSSFSEQLNGQDTRLTFLTDGSYVDTDESGCNFSVSTTGTTRSITWSGGSTSFQVSQ